MNSVLNDLRTAALAAVLTLIVVISGRAESTNSQSATAPAATPTGVPGTKIVLFPATNIPTDGAVDHHPSVSLSISDDDDDSDKTSSKSSSRGPKSPFSEVMDDIVPLWGILATFGMPVLVVFIVFYFRHRRRQDNLVLAREFLNKGMPVPPQLLDSSNSYMRESSLPPAAAASVAFYDERRGIKYIFIGLGIMLAFYFYDNRETYWAWGVIPLVIGCGYLVSGRFSRQRERDAAAFQSGSPVPPVPPTGPSSQ